MLHRVHFRNLLLLQDAELSLQPGLIAITGETGAGKTAFTRGLALLTGGKATGDIRGAFGSESWLEGEWDAPATLNGLSELLPDDPEEAQRLLLARRVSERGSRCYAWGRGCTIDHVSSLAPELLQMTGQHAARTLLRRSAQLGLVDRYAGASHEKLLERTATHYEQWQQLRAAQAAWEQRMRDRERELDLATHELEDIRAVAPTPDEEDRLQAEHDQLAHHQEIATALETISEALYGTDGAVAQLGRAIETLLDARRYAPHLTETHEVLSTALDLVNESAGALGGEIDADPERLVQLEARLSELARLRRRYAPTIAEVCAYAEQLATRVSELENAQATGEHLDGQVAAAKAAYDKSARALRKARQQAAGALIKRAQQYLHELGMPEAELSAAWDEREPSRNGIDEVMLMLAANKGLEAGNIADAASGGEMSRLHLALVLAAADSDSSQHTPMLFDEVDAGIGGGQVADALRQQLRALAAKRQVFVVTHLPQIAAAADQHLLVEKRTDGDLTTGDVREIAGDERLGEIARMMGGDPADETSRRAAQQLLG